MSLDDLRRPVRHLVIALAAALLSWTGSDLVPVLRDHGPTGALMAALLVQVTLTVTPLVRTYGVGTETPARHARE